jgi:predicted amidohydrolase
VARAHMARAWPARIHFPFRHPTPTRLTPEPDDYLKEQSSRQLQNLGRQGVSGGAVKSCIQMSDVRIALANIHFPESPEKSVSLAERAIAQAATEDAAIICFPECFVPGYRAPGKQIPPPDPKFLEYAWSAVAAAAAKGGVVVVLGTERIQDGRLLATALVVNRDGTIAGFQDKVQIDPSEEATYSHGSGRRIFQVDSVKFGVVICHEGWRYPETVRWAARRGAQIIFHPHFHEAEAGSYRPAIFADPANTFHEKATMCRAAENTVYFATVNCASAGSATTSAIVRPDGTLLKHQPYGEEGLLIADLDLKAATGLLASRCRTDAMAAS